MMPTLRIDRCEGGVDRHQGIEVLEPLAFAA